MSEQPEIDATQIEVNRLRHLLRRYDVCECGAMRIDHHPEHGRMIEPILGFYQGNCKSFRLKTPADPLETVVDGRALSEMVESNDPNP